jgi:hypothetical protein
METAETTASRAPQESQRWTPGSRKPRSLRGHFMDLAHRGSMAGLAQTIPQCLDMLAAIAALGGARRLAGCLAYIPFHAR